eukprot:83495_1
MANLAWIQERKRLYLLSYKELLYLLKKYPKSNPYPSPKRTKNQCTQTSPNRYNQSGNRTYKNIVYIGDTDTTAVMTPSPTSRRDKSKPTVSPATTTTPTVIMSPSPETKKKRQCNALRIHHTPSTKAIANMHINTDKSIKSIQRVHASAMKASHSLLRSLVDPNDSENDTEHIAHKRNTKRKRSFQQFNDSHGEVPALIKTLSECSIEEHRPLKKRKISNKRNRNKVDIDSQHREERKNMLLDYYQMNINTKERINEEKLNGSSTKKATKPKLVRSRNQIVHTINTHVNTKRKLIFNSDTVSFSVSNSYQSIDAMATNKPHRKGHASSKKSNAKKTKKATMSTIRRRLEQDKSPTPKKQNKKKKRNRRSSLQLQEAKDTIKSHSKVSSNTMNDATFFGLLPELDEQDVKQCDELVNLSRNEALVVEYEEKQMSPEEKQMTHEEIVRFENSSTPRYGKIEKEWKERNESIPDLNGSQKVVITTQHRYTPLWRASSKLPAAEKFFDAKKLKAANDPHPLHRYDAQYLNSQDVSPTTKIAQESMESDVVEATHSQIVAKYQQNVTCFGTVSNSINEEEQWNGGKESLFENTDFSADQQKMNSLLADSAKTDNEDKYLQELQMQWKDKIKKTQHKYSVFAYPQ